MDKQKVSFTRDDTLALKGIGVLLMILHHLFSFPDRLQPSLAQRLFLLSPVPGFESLLQLLALAGKFCVPLFFFLAGFGQYRSWEQHRGRFSTMKRLRSFYLSYWKVFLIVIPAAFLLFGGQPRDLSTAQVYAYYDRFELFPFIKAFWGEDAIYCGEWWFIRPYLVCTVCMPLWTALISRKSLKQGLLLMLGLILLFYVGKRLTASTLFALIFDENPYCLTFYLGALLAKDNTLEHMADAWRSHQLDRCIINIPLIVLLLLLPVCLPGLSEGEVMLLICAPVVMLLLLTVHRLSFVQPVLRIYGKHSTNIWLFHTFLCYYFLAAQRLVYFPHYGFLTLVWAAVLFLGLSCLIDLFWKGLGCLLRPLSGAFKRRADA